MFTGKMAANNTYESVRKQRLEENKKRFHDLGILTIKNSLSHLNNSDNNSKPRVLKHKNEEPVEPRRSTRARNSVSYADDLDIGLPIMRKRSGSKSSWDSYIARPAEECIMASYEDRICTLKVADEFQANLKFGNPSFVKSMGLPAQFCKDHLPKAEMDMILVDETGAEYDAKYLGKRAGLSGGWRGFALDHKLDDGDALVFELVEPDRFKVYTFRLSSCCDKSEDVNVGETTGARDAAKKSKKRDLQAKDATKKSKKGSSRTRKSKKAAVEQEESMNDEVSQQDEEAENGSLGTVSESADVKKSETTTENDSENKVVLRTRKKAAPKLFRKKA